MINRELIEYIKDQKKSVSDEAITEALLKVGWHEEDVKAGFLRANAELRSAQDETESVAEPSSTEPTQQVESQRTESASLSVKHEDQSEEREEVHEEEEKETAGSDATPFNGVEIDSPVTGGNEDTDTTGVESGKGEEGDGQQKPLETTTKSSLKEHGVEIDSPVLAEEERKEKSPEPSQNASELSMGSGIPYTSSGSSGSSLKQAEDKLSGIAPAEQQKEQEEVVEEAPEKKESLNKGFPQEVPVDQVPADEIDQSSGSSVGKILLMLIGAVLLIAAGGVAGYFAYTEFVEREGAEVPQSEDESIPQESEQSLYSPSGQSIEVMSELVSPRRFRPYKLPACRQAGSARRAPAWCSVSLYVAYK